MSLSLLPRPVATPASPSSHPPAVQPVGGLTERLDLRPPFSLKLSYIGRRKLSRDYVLQCVHILKIFSGLLCSFLKNKKKLISFLIDVPDSELFRDYILQCVLIIEIFSGMLCCF